MSEFLSRVMTEVVYLAVNLYMRSEFSSYGRYTKYNNCFHCVNTIVVVARKKNPHLVRAIERHAKLRWLFGNHLVGYKRPQNAGYDGYKNPFNEQQRNVYCGANAGAIIYWWVKQKTEPEKIGGLLPDQLKWRKNECRYQSNQSAF